MFTSSVLLCNKIVLALAASACYGQDILPFSHVVQKQIEKEAYVLQESNSYKLQVNTSDVIQHIPSLEVMKHLAQERIQQRFEDVWCGSRQWRSPSTEAGFSQSKKPRFLLCRDREIFDWEEGVTEVLILKPDLAKTSTWAPILEIHSYFSLIGVDIDSAILESLGLDSNKIKELPFYQNFISKRPFSAIGSDADKYLYSSSIVDESTMHVYTLAGVDQLKFNLSGELAERTLFSNSGQPKHRFRFTSYEKIKEHGFPMQIDVEEFAFEPADPEDIRGKLKLTYSMKISDLEINTLDKHSISPPPIPAGTLIVDTVSEVVYPKSIVDKDLLDRPTKQDNKTTKNFGLILAATVTLAAFLIIIWRKRRHRLS